MRKILFFVCLILCFHVGIGYAFFSGTATHQTRTIGGKNPLKQRNFRRGNPQTRVYHNSSCSYFKSKKCTILFKSAEEARLSGFRPCSRCGG
ncbi:MAG: hypothetical protein IJU76_08910 [Desulfovibrionaceae bacterium]|nr:hypothetical protein [Desulfovibrionaceae bacterium]